MTYWMLFADKLPPKRYDIDSKNEPPSKPHSFSKSKFRSSPTLLAVVKPCSWPPLGLPSESVTNVKVGVMPRSSSHVRVPYQSPSRCSRGRTNWNGNGASERVPAGASVSSARVTNVVHKKTTMSKGTRVQDLVRMGCPRFFCVS